VLGTAVSLPVPQTAVTSPPPAVTTIGTSPGHPRPRAPGRAGPGRAAGQVTRAARALGLRPADQALAVRPAAGGHGHGSRAAGARAGHHARHRGRLPASRPAPGATASVDPASSGSASGSAASGAGAGTGQLATPAPPGAGAWLPSVRLVRITASRWPAGLLRADDPAVSPD
jgi:hypothetical protein